MQDDIYINSLQPMDGWIDTQCSRRLVLSFWSGGFWTKDGGTMERGPVHNLIGGTYVMRQVMDYMVTNTPEYQ